MIDPYLSFLVVGAHETERGGGPRELLATPARAPDAEPGAPGARVVPGVRLVGEIDRCAICKGDGICETCKGSGDVDSERCPDCEGRGECLACDGDG